MPVYTHEHIHTSGVASWAAGSARALMSWNTRVEYGVEGNVERLFRKAHLRNTEDRRCGRRRVRMEVGIQDRLAFTGVETDCGVDKVGYLIDSLTRIYGPPGVQNGAHNGGVPRVN